MPSPSPDAPARSVSTACGVLDAGAGDAELAGAGGAPRGGADDEASGSALAGAGEVCASAGRDGSAAVSASVAMKTSSERIDRVVTRPARAGQVHLNRGVLQPRGGFEMRARVGAVRKPMRRRSITARR